MHITSNESSSIKPYVHTQLTTHSLKFSTFRAKLIFVNDASIFWTVMLANLTAGSSTYKNILS